MTSDQDLDLLSEEELRAEAEALLKKAKKEAMNSLASVIESKLKDRINNKANKHAEWLECSHLYYGNMYSAAEYKETPFANSTTRSSRPDFNIVRTKVDTAIAQCIDMQFAVGEKNWDLWPAANSSGEQDVKTAQLMSDEIAAQLDQCRYAFHARNAIRDRVLLGTGILKGPINTGKVETIYAKDQNTGVWLSDTVVTYAPTVTRVDPWFFFPDDTVAYPEDMGDAIEVHPMSAVQLMALTKHKGFDADAILEAIKKGAGNYQEEHFSEYKKLVSCNPALFKDKFCVIEYHGPLKKKDIVAASNKAPTYETPLEDYFGETWVVNGLTIRLELENIEGSFETPYSVSAWKADPSCVFGFGHPLTMKDHQRVVTQTWHMILDNASISSGPQAALNSRLITPADGKWEMGSRKVWYMNDPMAKVGDAIQFFNAPNVLENLIPVLGMAREFSEEESATSALASGMASTQLGASATGDMIAMKNSTVLLDAASDEWDDQVTAKIIRRFYSWNMQYSEKDDIKGNFSIDVRSANEYKNKQIHARDLEKLSVEMGQNPHIAKWVKPDVLTTIRFSLMALPTRNLMRTQEEADAWEKQQQEQAAQSDPAAIKAQVDMAKVEVEKSRVAMEQQVNNTKLQIEQMRLQMEGQVNAMKEEVARANTQSMALAAQASTLKATLDYQARMAKVQLDGHIAGINSQADALKFDVDKQLEVAALQQQGAIAEQENEIYKEEIKLKKQGKEGI